MSAQHTAGPWVVIVERGDDHFVIPAWDDESAICRLNGCGPEVKANARLIAAAPDLLAVLPQLLVNMKGDGHDYRDCYKAGLAAIAKATGAA